MANNKLVFFSAASRADAEKTANKLTKMENLEADLMDIAVNELTHVVEYEKDVEFSLDDDEHLKKAMRLKDNATRTMLLLNRLSIYSMAKRGVLPKELGNGAAPDREMEQALRIVDAAKAQIATDVRFK